MKAFLPTRKKPRLSWLNWAWLGLIFSCVAFGASSWYLARLETPSHHITLHLLGQPDRFALRVDGAQDLSSLIPSGQTPPPPPEQADEHITDTHPTGFTATTPNIRVPKPKPPPPSTRDVLEDESNIIRLEDLPPAGTTWARHPVPAPDPRLLTPTQNGPYPRRSLDGRTASKYYIAKHTPRENIPKVALIIGGLGLNADFTERAITELPPQITLAFAPYGTDLPRWTKKARRAGHEVVLEIPMEGFRAGSDQLGPASLLGTHTKVEIEERLDWMMTRFSGYFAVTNYRGTKFSLTPEKLSIVTDKLTKAGVAYIDDTGNAKAVVLRSGTHWMSVDQLIDPMGTAILPALQNLTEQATPQSGVIGKSYATPDNITAIANWANTLVSNQYQLVPASSLLQTPPQ